jgi:hypothetical protein
MESKKCLDCLKEKPIEEFYLKNYFRKSYRMSRCKPCTRARDTRQRHDVRPAMRAEPFEVIPKRLRQADPIRTEPFYV